MNQTSEPRYRELIGRCLDDGMRQLKSAISFANEYQNEYGKQLKTIMFELAADELVSLASRMKENGQAQ